MPASAGFLGFVTPLSDNLYTMSDQFDIGKGFAHSAGDLADSEITRLFHTVEEIRLRYAGKRNSAENLEAMRDEILTKLMEQGILATLDPAPCFYGEPPVLEIIGRVGGHADHKYGFDHEKKGWEVRKSVERNEDWLGEKEGVNKRRDSKKK